eukprot:347967-Chlamydomonas_euryale.AAC.1
MAGGSFTVADARMPSNSVLSPGVETAGDCYIVAGALMKWDEDGYMAVDPDADPSQGAANVLAFGKAALAHARRVFM